MVGDDEHERLVVRVLEQPADQPVDVLVVVADHVLVRAAGLVLAVLGVHVLPEAVMDPVGAHLDEGEELPRLRREEVVGEPEALVGHLVDLPQEVVLVVGAEVRAVEEVLADDLARPRALQRAAGT